jgi:galactokinase
MALVDQAAVPEFIALVQARYQAETGLKPRIFATSAADGAGLVMGGQLSGDQA